MRPAAALVALGVIVGASAAQATDKLGSDFAVIDTRDSGGVCGEHSSAGARDDKFAVFFRCSSGGPGPPGGTDGIAGRFFSRSGTILKNAPLASINEIWKFGYPAIASAPSGKFVVVWEDSSVLTGNAPEIYARHFNAAGASSYETFTVNTTQQGPQRRPSVVMFPDDSFLTVWLSGDERWRIMGQRFGPQGEYSGPEFGIATGSKDHNRPTVRPKVTALSSGRFVVAWDTAFGLYNATGRLMKRVKFASPKASNIAGLNNGRFVMVWSEYPVVYGQMYDASGARFGGAFQVSANAAGDAEPAVAALTGGGFVVAWDAAADASPIAARVYNARGNPIGPEFRADTEFLPGVLDNEDWDWLPTFPTVAALSSGGFVVTYEWAYGIRGQRFKAP